jgi:hypothetical protein
MQKALKLKYPPADPRSMSLFEHLIPIYFPPTPHKSDKRDISNKKGKGTGKSSSAAPALKPSTAESADEQKSPTRSSTFAVNGEGAPDTSPFDEAKGKKVSMSNTLTFVFLVTTFKLTYEVRSYQSFNG